MKEDVDKASEFGTHAINGVKNGMKFSVVRVPLWIGATAAEAKEVAYNIRAVVNATIISDNYELAAAANTLLFRVVK